MERTMSTDAPASLLAFLATVPDPRSAHGRRHPLPAMLAAVCCAILCGARGFKPIAQWLHDQDIALVHALGFTRKPPKWGAFRKLLIALAPGPFEAALALWAEAASADLPPEAEGGLEPVAMDGKSARGSIGRHGGAVHRLSVMAQRSGLTLRQAEVGAKTNEHKAALGLLKGLVLEGRVVTGGAMFCQRDLCAQVVADGGHDFVVVKEDQPELLRDIEAAFTRAASPALSPPPASAHRAAVHRAPGAGPARRPGRVAAAEGDRPAQRLSRLAPRRPGLSDRTGGRAARRWGEPRGGLRDHQRAEATGRRGEAAGVVARALGDREPLALRAGRDDGRRRQPGADRFGPAGAGRVPQRGDRLAEAAGRRQHRRGPPAERGPGPQAPQGVRHFETRIRPGKKWDRL
jgi:hypothetical protein